MRKILIACTVVMLAAASGCSSTGGPGGMLHNVTQAFRNLTSAPSRSPIPPPPASSCGKPAGGRYVGFSVPGYPASTAPLAATEKAAGVTANVVSTYYSLGTPINTDAVIALCAAHKLPIVEFDSDNMPLEKIINGSQDKTLASYALKLATLQIPVGVDFNHEFNGPWFPWGFKNTERSQFVAAWRHIVDVFREYGATNVIWIWNPNVTSRYTLKDLEPWYPGDNYVTWVGLDGYFYAATDTYASVFNYTFDQVHAFTHKPIFIVETGADPVAGRPRAIASIFEGAAKTPGLLGLIWFDYNKNSVHNWYFNNDPPALAAFKTGAAGYMAGH